MNQSNYTSNSDCLILNNLRKIQVAYVSECQKVYFHAYWIAQNAPLNLVHTYVEDNRRVISPFHIYGENAW